MESDIESSPTCGFFAQRAKFIPRKNAEELQAAKELVKKIEQENSRALEIEKMMSGSNKRRKKGKKKAESQHPDDRGGIADVSFSEVILSSASKRRLKALRDQQEEEIKRIEAENQRILSSIDTNGDYTIETIKESEEEFKKIAVLTIMYISKISRIRCYEDDKFLDIFPKVAKLLELNATNFLLCFKTRNITVDDTPKSLKLTEHDILECIPYKDDETNETKIEDNGNSVKITFQTSDTKKKIDMLIHKLEKMQDIMKRYSEERKIPLEQLVFEFDGEKLSGDETPVDLDMESECCIDVTVLDPTPISKVRKTRGKKKK